MIYASGIFDYILIWTATVINEKEDAYSVQILNQTETTRKIITRKVSFRRSGPPKRVLLVEIEPPKFWHELVIVYGI